MKIVKILIWCSFLICLFSGNIYLHYVSACLGTLIWINQLTLILLHLKWFHDFSEKYKIVDLGSWD